METSITKPPAQDGDIFPDRVRRMTHAEIAGLFERYNFQDEHGNSLTDCIDFVELLNMATATKSED